MPTPSTHRPPDSKACAVARAVGEVVHPAKVILFGSRARGDFTPDSDIDLLIITGSGPVDQQTYQRTSAAAHRKVEELYDGPIDVDMVRMSEGTFHDGRRARNHVAGQAVRDGFDANGDKVTYDTIQSRPTGPTYGSPRPMPSATSAIWQFSQKTPGLRKN